MSQAVRQVAALSICQGLVVINNIALVALSSLVGYLLASNKAWSTLPATAYLLGGALTTFPLSFFMKRHGRRAGFLLGAAAGAVGGALCTWGIVIHSFTLFCVGALISGVYSAAGGFYRFAAADATAAAFRSRAISFVLAGGMIGGILGPEASKYTRNLTATPYAGAYGMLIVFVAMAAAILFFVKLPMPNQAEHHGPRRPLKRIARQPVFVVACLGAVTSYAVMNLLMGATPLAMDLCGLSFSASTFVIESHILGMFVPALFAGWLVHRFGALTIMGAGIALFIVCVAIALSGQTTLHFWLSSTLQGVGWCFLYVGATTLLAEAHTPAEKAETQGLNDLCIFVVMVAFSLVSGAILARLGWSALNLAALPLLLVTGAAVLWLIHTRRGPTAPVLVPAK
ncbi:MAG: MFS transporter [Burkholderiales bacterium]|nr:MFS transporter [Burkholderiales bacterium]